MDKSKDQITYIFGAGASFYSMPLVQNFEERFRFFLGYLRGRESSKIHKSFIRESEEFIDQVKSHLSFDTFFKKLFHTKKDDLIIKYKAILLAYFIYEHLISPEIFKSITSSNEKTYSIDPRYEALIAGLLKPVQGFSFGRKINFITWNYDLNLLLALKNFFNSENTIRQFLDSQIVRTNTFQIGDEIAVYHINGYVFHPLLNNIGKLDSTLLSGVIMNLVSEFSSRDSDLFVGAQRINFSWESFPKENVHSLPNVINEAMFAVQRSKNVVLVGYSLPAYNRIYDSVLINKNTLENSNFIIQDIIANDIRQIVEGDFGLNYDTHYNGMAKLKTQSNCNSFVLV